MGRRSWRRCGERGHPSRTASPPEEAKVGKGEKTPGGTVMAKGRNATTIRSKLIRQMLIVGVVPLLVLGGLTYFLMSNAIDLLGRGLDNSAQAMEQRVVGATLTKAAEDVTSRIDTYVEERVKDVAIWASDPLVIEAAVRASALARGRGWPGYPEIAQDQPVIDRIEAEMKTTRARNP